MLAAELEAEKAFTEITGKPNCINYLKKTKIIFFPKTGAGKFSIPDNLPGLDASIFESAMSIDDVAGFIEVIDIQLKENIEENIISTILIQILGSDKLSRRTGIEYDDIFAVIAPVLSVELQLELVLIAEASEYEVNSLHIGIR